MAGGYAGKILEIDLSTKKIKKTPLDIKEAKKYLGARGLGAKWLWDRTKPGGHYLDPNTPICYMAAPLVGLPTPTASRLTIVTRSASTFPKSNPRHTGIVHTNTGGRWAPELKFAGYDAVIVTGASATPVGIVIENDDVKIVPAGKHWGMGCYDLQNALDADLGRDFRSIYIGPAGENLVRYANIMNEIHRAAGRGGGGAVMGSKKLKFISVRGTNGIEIANKRAWEKANKKAWKELTTNPGYEDYRKYGTAAEIAGSSDWGSQAVYNFKEGTYVNIDLLSGERAANRLWVGDDSCYMCPMACLHRGVIRAGRFSGMTHDGPEYETGVMMGANCGVTDFDGHMANIAAADDYGLCTISMGNVLGFCMECYEKGVITARDLDGIALKWGDVDAMLELQKKVAYGTGCGKLLGQNLRALVDVWGKGCGDYAVETKGQGWAAWNVRAFDGFELTYATANRGGDHITGETVPIQNGRLQNDNMGICWFAEYWGFTAESMKDLLNAATGFKLSMDDFWKNAERIYTLERSFNMREGFTREDDSIPPRFFKEALSIGAAKGKILNYKDFNKLLDDYYKERGWDKNGVPTKARLKELGLDFVNI